MTIFLVNEETVSQAAADIVNASWVAVDTEFHVGQNYLPRLYLVQVQVPGGDTWLIDPLTGMVDQLGDALCQVNWVVHGGHYDLRILMESFGRLPEVMDTQVAAGLVQPTFPASLASLVEEYLGVHLEKSATLSDWSQRPLTETQIDYAAKDVQLLAPLWQRLRELLVAKGRLELAVEASHEAQTTALAHPSPNGWRHFELESLTPSQAAVFRELVAWREEQARTTDSHPRTIATDTVLFALARRAPATLEQLKGKRGLPKRLWRDHASTILECIHRGLNLGTSAPPRYIQRNTNESQKLRWLQCLANTLGPREDFAPNLVLPGSLLEDCLLQNPSRDELEAMLSWRAPLCGEALMAALQGTITLRLGKKNVELSLLDP